MNTKKQSFSGPAGEHLVLGELLRRGYEAYLAHGETQKGWDLVSLRESGKNIRVQVKSIDWPHEFAVNGNFESGFDVLVVVLHNRENYPRYLIIPQQDLEPMISELNPDRKGNQRTLTIGKNFTEHKEKNLSTYENNWVYFDKKET